MTGAETTGRNSAEQTESSLSWEMDNRRVKELFAQDEDRGEDSIPLADDDPRDIIDESFISEEKKRVRNTRGINQPLQILFQGIGMEKESGL